MNSSKATDSTEQAGETMHQTIKRFNESARKIHGKDINVMVARAVAFGHDDNLVLVRGKKHSLVAADIARVSGPNARTEEVTSHGYYGEPCTYSTVSF